MADRVVDDSNPEARLSSKEIQKLICDDEDDPPPNSWDLQTAIDHLQEVDQGKNHYNFFLFTSNDLLEQMSLYNLFGLQTKNYKLV